MTKNLFKVYLTTILLIFTISMNCFAVYSSDDSLVKSVVICNTGRVTADCILKPFAMQNLKDQFSNIQLGFIPKPLGELILTQDQLRRKLGIFASNLELPEKVVIRRKGSIIKKSEIENRIAKLCNEELGKSKKIKLDFSRIPNHILLPGAVESWKMNSNSTNKLGMRLFEINAQTDSGNFKQLVQVKVIMLVEVAQLIRLAKPGERIGKDMVRSKIFKIKNMRARLPLNYKDALGKSLSRYKSAGTILRASDVREVKNVNLVLKQKAKANSCMAKASRKIYDRDNWAVRPGEQVEFEVKRGKISLIMPARAIQGGNAGDRISLINLKNKRRITGMIVAEGKVQNDQK